MDFNLRVALLNFCLLMTTITTIFAQETTDSLTWTGCGVSKKAFMDEIAKVYEKKTGIQIKLSGGGATKGIRDVASKKATMGGTCRHAITKGASIIDEEKDAKLIQVAWDAIVALVNADNPFANISTENLRAIVDGKIKTWAQLLAVSSPSEIAQVEEYQKKNPTKKFNFNSDIALVTREGKQSGVEYIFRLLIFADPEYDFKANAIIVKSTSSVESVVEENQNSLGLDGVSSARKTNASILSLDGIEPNKKNIAAGIYKLFRPLYLVVNKESNNSTINKFVDFILSQEGQEIISQQETVNLQEGEKLVGLWENKVKSWSK